ncbi:MAG: YbaK/EbsC family protein [Chloroflexales bacterium]|nr:YbaK/EbsC family protein [Chloroflexales bacterium]
MMCREKIEAYLRANLVPFGVHAHTPAYTAQAVAEHEHISNQLMVKAVIVVADGELVMLALPASRRVDLALVRTMLDVREVRLASEAELAEAFPDCEIGAAPPFGNLYGVPLYADQSLENDRVIFFQAGTHTVALSIAYADYKRLAEPTIVSFTHHYALTVH